MPQYNATDAMFFGFRIFQRDPILVAVLSALMAVFTLIAMQLVWRDFAAFMVSMQAFTAASQGQSTPEEAQSVFGDLLASYGALLASPAMLGYLALSLVVGAVMQAAILRHLVREERGGWVLGLQFGMDEVRVLVVGIAVGLILVLVTCLAFFLVMLLTGLSMIAHPALAVIVGLAAFIAATLGVLLLGTRFCAAQAASIGERKFVVLGSWAITKGRMWGLLGAFVVLFFIALVAGLVVGLLAPLLAPQASELMQGTLEIGDVDNPGGAFLSPGYVLMTALNAIVAVGATCAYAGVGAYAYRMAGVPSAGAPAVARTE